MSNETHFTAFHYAAIGQRIALITAADITAADKVFKAATGIDPTKASSGVAVSISTLTNN